MDESWEYEAKQNKSDGKSQQLYDFTQIWDIKLSKWAKKTKIHRHSNCMVVTKGEKGWGR